MTITATGVKELDKKFATLTGTLQRKYIRQGVRAASSEIIKEVRKRVPRSTRTRTRDQWSESVRTKRGGAKNSLSRSLFFRPSSQWRSRADLARKGIIAGTVGHRWPEGAHAHLIEFPHRIVAWGRSTGQTSVPKPYFRPGFQAARPKAAGAIRRKVVEGINKEGRK